MKVIVPLLQQAQHPAGQAQHPEVHRALGLLVSAQERGLEAVAAVLPRGLEAVAAILPRGLEAVAAGGVALAAALPRASRLHWQGAGV